MTDSWTNPTHKYTTHRRPDGKWVIRNETVQQTLGPVYDREEQALDGIIQIKTRTSKIQRPKWRHAQKHQPPIPGLIEE